MKAVLENILTITTPATIKAMPISDQAVFFMGDQETDNVLVFHSLRYARLKTFFKHLLAEEDISKNITFHRVRHTSPRCNWNWERIFTVSKNVSS